MTDKERVAKECGMTVSHLDALVKMKRLCGKTTPQIERDLMQIAWMLDNQLVFVNGKELN